MSADASWDAELHRSAKRELEVVPDRERELIIERVVEAAGYEDPADCPKTKPLTGDYAEGLLAVRGGKWRAILTLVKPRLVVLMVEKRKQVYDDHKIEAAQKRREDSRRVVTDGGGDKEALVLADEPMRPMQWHRVPFAPDELHGVWRGLSRDCFETVCGREIDRDDVRDVETEPWSKVVAHRDACPGCNPANERVLVTDGGTPEYWGRCDTCGEPLTNVYERVAVYSSSGGHIRFRFCSDECHGRFERREVHEEFAGGELVTDGGEDLRTDVREAYVWLDKLRERVGDSRYPDSVEDHVGVAMVGLQNALAAIDRYDELDEELATDGGVETVWVKGNNHSRGGPLILHTDPDCPRLRRAKNVYEKCRSVYPDNTRLCKFCTGEGVEYHSQGSSGIWEQLEEMDPDELATDGGHELDPDTPGVPDGEGEPFAELAERLRANRRLFDDRDRETFGRAVEAWGIRAQMDMAVEECAEFIVASRHHGRGKAGLDAVVDELAAHLPCDGKRRAGSAAEVIDGALESARGGGQ